MSESFESSPIRRSDGGQAAACDVARSGAAPAESATSIDSSLQTSRRAALLAVAGVAAGAVVGGCGGDMQAAGMGACASDAAPAGALIVMNGDTLGVGEGMAVPNSEIILTRDAQGFMAVNAKCTHAGCLTAYAAAQMSIVCQCHGSAFNIDGSVKKGPATLPLYRVSLCRRGSDNALVINPNSKVTTLSDRVT